MQPPESRLVPCLPENAPFSPEQRAYLNGFLAGLFSRSPATDGVPLRKSPGEQLVPLCVLFGSQTGNAEKLARRIAREASKRGFAPTLHELNKYPLAQLPSEERLLVVTSTFGDGEPPDNAKEFWAQLIAPESPRLPATHFSICALGDSSYPKFCGFGKDLDLRMEGIGAIRAHPRVDCDLEFEEPFSNWLNSALTAMGSAAATSDPVRGSPGSPPPAAEPEAVASPYSPSNPFPATLVCNRKLNGPGSEKDTRHFEIALTGSGMAYEAGDALGVFPVNCLELVEDILAALNFSGEESVPGRDRAGVSLREALARHYEITRIPQTLLKNVAEQSGDVLLKKITEPEANGELTAFLHGREIIDVLLAHPCARFSPGEFVAQLKKLRPRLYSIASSPKEHPDAVHLTVNIVRFESHARRRKGVCSTYLADRHEPATTLPIYVHSNRNFRPPSNGDTPMIMVGPGTGIAPFRAFLQERRATGARGRNWLFYGDQREATDFMYRDELEGMRRDGSLSRMDTAFSRDQAEKVYVQHRIQQNAGEVFKWLEEGASFYVCGEAARMAKDVDAALQNVVRTAGGFEPEQAAQYVSRLKSENRYQRDVY